MANSCDRASFSTCPGAERGAHCGLSVCLVLSSRRTVWSSFLCTEYSPAYLVACEAKGQILCSPIGSSVVIL